MTCTCPQGEYVENGVICQTTEPDPACTDARHEVTE